MRGTIQIDRSRGNATYVIFFFFFFFYSFATKVCCLQCGLVLYAEAIKSVFFRRPISLLCIIIEKLARRANGGKKTRAVVYSEKITNKHQYGARKVWRWACYSADVTGRYSCIFLPGNTGTPISYHTFVYPSHQYVYIVTIFRDPMSARITPRICSEYRPRAV